MSLWKGSCRILDLPPRFRQTQSADRPPRRGRASHRITPSSVLQPCASTFPPDFISLTMGMTYE